MSNRDLIQEINQILNIKSLDIEDIFYNYANAEASLLSASVEVIFRNGNDTDPEFQAYYGEQSRLSVVIKYKGSYFKSHQVTSSFGREDWSDWRVVEPKIITVYHYDESTY